MCKKYDLKNYNTLVVGDGSNDIKMFEVSGLSIATEAVDELKMIADYKLDFSSMSHIKSIVEFYNSQCLLK